MVYKFCIVVFTQKNHRLIFELHGKQKNSIYFKKIVQEKLFQKNIFNFRIQKIMIYIIVVLKTIYFSYQMVLILIYLDQNTMIQTRIN